MYMYVCNALSIVYALTTVYSQVREGPLTHALYMYLPLIQCCLHVHVSIGLYLFVCDHVHVAGILQPCLMYMYMYM